MFTGFTGSVAERWTYLQKIIVSYRSVSIDAIIPVKGFDTVDGYCFEDKSCLFVGMVFDKWIFVENDFLRLVEFGYRVAKVKVPVDYHRSQADAFLCLWSEYGLNSTKAFHEFGYVMGATSVDVDDLGRIHSHTLLFKDGSVVSARSTISGELKVERAMGPR